MVLRNLQGESSAGAVIRWDERASPGGDVCEGRAPLTGPGVVLGCLCCRHRQMDEPQGVHLVN